MRVLSSALVAALCVAVASANPLSETEYQSLFSTFITQHSKSYATEEFFNRFNTFKSNLEAIRSHNADASHSHKLGLNEFADLTNAEFKATKLGYNHRKNSYLRQKNEVAATEFEIEAAPASIDWRTQNAVTPVKNQGQCGSCWAFSTTGAVEGAVAIAGRGLISLSEQQLVDCSTSFGNLGCNGGLMDDAFQYIIANKGITSEANYPYTGRDGKCKNPLPASVATISGYTDVPEGDEASLLTFAVKGPVAVAIEADQMAFQLYKSGILSTGCGTNLDHGVLVVGYGTENNTDYWIVKNSWGATWGEKGYLRIIRNKNMCGIALAASQPIA